MGIKLFPHQQKALEQTKGFENVAYYLDMGLGKTFVGSEKMKDIGKGLNLLVCQCSKVDDWVSHFETYYSDYEVIDCTIPKNMKRLNENGLIENQKYILVINYDLLFRRPYFQKLEGFTMMLDESSTIQNEKAKRSKFVLKMKPSNVILLSGTPSSGKYENLWSQIHLLGWDISQELYNKQYVNWVTVEFGGFKHKAVDKENPYKNVDRLKRKLHNHGAVFMKTEECFDLPEQIFTKIKVKTSKEYKKFMRNSILILDVENLVEFKDDSDFYGKDITERVELVGDTTLTKRLYARQLCGQYNKDKLKAFEDLLSSTQDRLIVFYNYNAELKVLIEIAERLERPISQVNGSVRDLTAYENENNSVTLIQYQAGAMGLNLQKANKIVYFTLTDKSELFEQSKKRIHRIGQNQPCFYYLMMCDGSLEDDILSCLEQRKDYNDELFTKHESVWE